VIFVAVSFVRRRGRTLGSPRGGGLLLYSAAPMARPARVLPALVAVIAAIAAAGCGTQSISVSKNAGQTYSGAKLFQQRCGGCHTLAAAATHGSAANIRTRERNDGPNFNVRCETVGRVLYAIRNGGFSGAIMPQNIVVGADADAVAAFVAKYSGKKAASAGGNCGSSPKAQ
jgi:mono/diheme cytochrome c family protein